MKLTLLMVIQQVVPTGHLPDAVEWSAQHSLLGKALNFCMHTLRLCHQLMLATGTLRATTFAALGFPEPEPDLAIVPAGDDDTVHPNVLMTSRSQAYRLTVEP